MPPPAVCVTVVVPPLDPQAAATATIPTASDITTALRILMRNLSVVLTTMDRLCIRPFRHGVTPRYTLGEQVVTAPFGGVPDLYAPRMTREMFEKELTELGVLLNEEARLCQRLLDGALEALIRPESDAADTVIAGDDDVDRVYLQVEHGVESLLARQSPVAVDLRFVLAVNHVNQNLERIGDQCVNIAKLSRLFVQQPLTPELLEDFTVMGNQASGMIATAMHSFVQRDLEQAESLVELDQVINERNHGLARRIVEGGFDESTIEMPLRAMLVARAIERIGDNAVDIGEQTAYLVTAAFREFTDASHPVH